MHLGGFPLLVTVSAAAVNSSSGVSLRRDSQVFWMDTHKDVVGESVSMLLPATHAGLVHKEICRSSCRPSNWGDPSPKLSHVDIPSPSVWPREGLQPLAAARMHRPITSKDDRIATCDWTAGVHLPGNLLDAEVSVSAQVEPMY